MHRWLNEDVPVAEIARRLGRSRQTIYNWLASQDDREPKARPSKLDSYMPYVESRLERFDLPATVLLRELREKGYEGGITILRDRVAKIKKRHVKRLVDRFETEPGWQAQVDWASCGTIVIDGRRRRLSLLVVVLGFSRTTWAQFVVSERRPVLASLLEACFHDFGGVPRELLFDNMKTVVEIPRRGETKAEIQTEFQHFADHWGFEVVACPAYWPRAKGKVERAIDYIKRSFLEGASFTDLDDLNAKLRHWLATVANVRVHGTTKQRPVDRFSDDREALLPLGDTPAYPSLTRCSRLVDADSRFSYLGVRYSADPRIMEGRGGVAIELHVGADQRIRAFHEGRLVAEHSIAAKGSPPKDDPLHARLRRQLRQRPPSEAPRGKAPRFDQLDSEDPVSALGDPPVVQSPDLSIFEQAAA